ncbi:hypothetical protein FFWV33_01000 [Flavobacterium faecale]|uniref:Uncharacterized protein n=1 Tax=Flavobacterium faecale TaxID=1355330 RepID=A0A2S1L8Z7_9FLAO|nr:hypothetical protein [Flavobacterium faecale]AWG20201.1 hypothetical protein FFWV33_01000 [Flavobacterium faecale]
MKNLFKSPTVYSLSEYESQYDNLLIEHFTINSDYDLKHFLMTEIGLYRERIECINNFGTIPEDFSEEDSKLMRNVTYTLEDNTTVQLQNIYVSDKEYYCQVIDFDKEIIKKLAYLDHEDTWLFLYNTKFSFIRIIEYLKLKKKEINIKTIPTLAFDLSDCTATEKIIYLQKLGIIDFLRKNNHVSINGLASALSAITGEKPTTIQSAINPIISRDAGQKNNPFNSENTVQKVEKQLIKIGFNIDETI